MLRNAMLEDTGKKKESKSQGREQMLRPGREEKSGRESITIPIDLFIPRDPHFWIVWLLKQEHKPAHHTTEDDEQTVFATKT